jgi:hypothetical protein
MKSKFLFPVLSSSLFVLSLLSSAHAMDRSHDEKDNDSPFARAAAAVQPVSQQAVASEPQQAKAAAAAQPAYDPSQFAQRDQEFAQKLRTVVTAAVGKLNVKNEKDFVQHRFPKAIYDRLLNPNGPTRELLRVLLLSSSRNPLNLDSDGQRALQGFLQGFTAEYREFVFDPAHKGTQNKDILKAQKDLALITLDGPANPQRDQQAFDVLEADPSLVETETYQSVERVFLDAESWAKIPASLAPHLQQDGPDWFYDTNVMKAQPLEDLQFVATMFAFQGRVRMDDQVLAKRLMNSKRFSFQPGGYSPLSTRYLHHYVNTTADCCLAVMRAEERVTNEIMDVGKAWELLETALGHRKEKGDGRDFILPEFDISRAKGAYGNLMKMMKERKEVADAVAERKAFLEQLKRENKARRAANSDDESDSDED